MVAVEGPNARREQSERRWRSLHGGAGSPVRQIVRRVWSPLARRQSCGCSMAWCLRGLSGKGQRRSLCWSGCLPP